LIFILAILLYLIFLSVLVRQFIVEANYASKTKSVISVNVIVAFKNEKENIINLINDLKNQNYNNELVKYILINDNSTDNSLEIAQNETLNDKKFIVLNLEEDSGKKQALKYGLKYAKNELIIHTDADVILNKSWINTFANYYEKTNFKLAIAPVIYTNEASIFQKLQSLEITNIAGITAGSALLNIPLMANGANLAYSKDLIPTFVESINKKASGDDMFFLEKVKTKYANKIRFIKSHNAIVYTYAEKNIKAFFNQRIRWFGKSSSFKNPFIITVGLFTTLINLFSILGIILTVIQPRFSHIFLLFLIIKFVAESFSSIIYCKYYNKQNLIYLIPILFLIYPVYVVFIGVNSLFITPKWKNTNI